MGSTRESPPWHSVRPGFPSERAHLGTPSVPVFHQRGPPLALRPSRFSIREGPPWQSVRPGFPSERPPLALRPSRFSIREAPLTLTSKNMLQENFQNFKIEAGVF